MKKVLFVVDERQMGGVSIQLENILKNIDYTKFEVDVMILSNHGDRLSSSQFPNVNFLYGSAYFSEIDTPLKQVLRSRSLVRWYRKCRVIADMKTGYILQKIKKERKKIVKKDYDIEIAFKDGFCALFTIAGGSAYKIHWLHYEYGAANPNKNYPSLFHKVMKQFDRIVAVSQGVLESFLKEYPVQVSTCVISNFIDEEQITSAMQEEVAFPVAAKVLLSIGRLHEVKGYLRFLDVWAKLLEEKIGQDWIFYIIGDGPLRNEIEQKIQDLRLKEHVVLLGAKDNPYAYLKKADLFVLPSYFESFGMVCLESLFLSVPVLATKTAGTMEIAKKTTGMYMVDNDEKSIYEGLRYLLCTPQTIQELKNNIDIQAFSKRESMRKILEVLDKDVETDER